MKGVSILTPTLNSAETVRDALASVRNQHGSTPVEHIVIDGGSTDGTVDLVREFTGIRLITGTDANLYDALNKGIAACTHDVVGFLNADDMLLPDAIETVGLAFASDPHTDIACFGARVEDLEGRVLVTHDRPENRSLDIADLLLRVPVINARFFRRSFLKALDGFDIRFPVAADRDLLVRAALKAPRFSTDSRLVYVYRTHPGSLTLGGAQSRRRIVEEHLRLAAHWWQRRHTVGMDDTAPATLWAHSKITGLLHGLLKRDRSLLRISWGSGGDIQGVPPARWLSRVPSLLLDRLRRTVASG